MIDLVINGKLNDRWKGMDITYYFPFECLEDVSPSLLYLLLAENVDNICTQWLLCPWYENLCSKIFGTAVIKVDKGLA